MHREVAGLMLSLTDTGGSAVAGTAGSSGGTGGFANGRCSQLNDERCWHVHDQYSAIISPPPGWGKSAFKCTNHKVSCKCQQPLQGRVKMGSGSKWGFWGVTTGSKPTFYPLLDPLRSSAPLLTHFSGGNSAENGPVRLQGF